MFVSFRLIWPTNVILCLSIFLPTGAILRLPIWGDPADDNCFDDEVYWEVRFFHLIKMIWFTEQVYRFGNISLFTVLCPLFHHIKSSAINPSPLFIKESSTDFPLSDIKQRNRKSDVLSLFIYRLVVFPVGARRRGERPTDAAVQQPLSQQGRVSVHLVYPSKCFQSWRGFTERWTQEPLLFELDKCVAFKFLLVAAELSLKEGVCDSLVFWESQKGQVVVDDNTRSRRRRRLHGRLQKAHVILGSDKLPWAVDGGFLQNFHVTSQSDLEITQQSWCLQWQHIHC